MVAPAPNSPLPTPEQEAFQGNERFQIRRCLGSGGFGVVYEAFDRKRSAVVGLKVLRRFSPSELYGFKQEFRTLSGIVHPNLVTLYELLVEAGRWFFSMELVPGTDFLTYVRHDPSLPSYLVRRAALTPDGEEDGGEDGEEDGEARAEEDGGGDGDRGALGAGDTRASLSVTAASMPDLPAGDTDAARGRLVPVHRLRPLSLGRLLRALCQLAEGLMALHAAGIVHRDIKPANVLCTAEGRVVLLDFGLAQDLASTEALGLDGQREQAGRAGTPDYVAPEQAAGQRATAASDWYSFGVMLYEALAGRLPFQGTPQQVLRQKITQDPLALPLDGAAAVLGTLCVRLLQREPGLRPRGEQILACLRELQLELDGAARTEVPAAGRPGRAQHEVLFIGREQQLATLSAAYSSYRKGQVVVALCHGDSGVGKSTLCRQFLKELVQIDKGLLLLSGRCHAHEDVPFKALDGVIDSLSRALSQRPREETQALLPRDISAAARLFPVLLQVAAIREAPPQRIADDLQARQAAFAALRELVSCLAARQTVVLYIDDLQWGDPDGLSLLLELLRPPEPPRILLLVAYRSEEAASSTALQLLRKGLSSELGTSVSTFDVQVDALPVQEAEVLALRMLPQAGKERESETRKEQAAFIAAESGGNPFFITELSRAAGSDALSRSPDEAAAGSRWTLDTLIRKRVARLPEVPQKLLSAVALAGQPVSRAATAIAVYGDAAETDEPQALALLRAERLLRVRHAPESWQGSGPREELLVYHDRIREAVVAGLAPAAAAAQHLRLFQGLLSTRHAEPEQMVFHLQHGGDLEGAARYAVEASAQAYKSLAYHQAMRLCRVALSTGKLSSADALIVKARLADALVGAGYPKEAALAYLELADAEPAAQSFTRRRQAAKQFIISGHVQEGTQVLRSLLSAARLRIPETSLGLYVSLVFYQLLVLGRGLQFSARSEAEVSAADLLRLDTCEAIASSTSVNPLLAANFWMQLLWHALRAGEPRRIIVALTGAAGLLFAFGAPRAFVRRILDRAFELAEQEGYAYGIGRCTFVRGHHAQLEGRWRDSLAELGRATEILRGECMDSTALIDFIGTVELLSLRWMGGLQRLDKKLQPYLKDAIERGRQSHEINARLIAGFMLLLREDEPERAEEYVQAALLRVARTEAILPQYLALEARILIRLYEGRTADAWRLHLEQRESVERTGILRVGLFRALWDGIVAVLALASGEPVSLAAGLAQRLARSRCHFAGPLSVLVRALSQQRLGRHAKALELLREAEEGLSACDMSLHAACARFRRGQWLGSVAGQERDGEALVQSARERMSREGVKDPERMAAMLVPEPSGPA